MSDCVMLTCRDQMEHKESPLGHVVGEGGEGGSRSF